ncbi:hypothetical protein BDA99DRAFT_589502 [Phascolomyces articulosus]|uniref:Galactose oxidase n=1 Tax=Phascolomyces articulosus TaxID=60185 RepID=A0AAD5JR35_9FUNG|nr:hypothetical protein BDA99DRAFT_589502 [Phascolomyces articulosus]
MLSFIPSLLQHTIVSPPVLLFSIVVILSVSHVTNGEYPSIPDIGGTIPKLFASTGFSLNDTMYTFGGQGADDFITNQLAQISFDDDGVLHRKVINYMGPLSYASQVVVLPDKDSIAVFGGFRNLRPNIRADTLELQVAMYRFSNDSWSDLPGQYLTAIGPPIHRQGHTAVMASNGLVYFQGGGLNAPYVSQMLFDSWSYNPETTLYTRLSLPPLNLYASTATALSDGRIVYVGGVYGQLNQTDLRSPFLLNRAMIYHTASDTWAEQRLNTTAINNFSLSRGYSSAVLGPEGRYIYYFGGDNAYTGPGTLEVYNDLWVLDTQTWTWNIPDVSGSKSDYFFYDTVDVLKLPNASSAEGGDLDFTTLKWVNNVTSGLTLEESLPRESGLSRTKIIVISVVCGVVGLVCIFLLFWFRHSTSNITGEPTWTEMSRLVSRIILFLLFIAFFVFLVIQAIESPTTTYTTPKSVLDKGIELPDIRFCFHGFTNENMGPTLQCETDIGKSCNKHIRQLNMSVHQPIFFGTGRTRCYMFYGDYLDDNEEPLRLYPTPIPQKNNGSLIGFYTQIGNTSEQVRLYTTFYHAEQNFNRKVYLNQPMPRLSDTEVNEWKAHDSSIISGDPFEQMEYANIQYRLEITEYLQPTWWNYVGFASVYNSSTVVKKDIQKYRIGTPTPGNYGGMGNINLKPDGFTILVNKEQRVYTLVNAFGFVGGIYGLLIAFQTAMFGYRPQSPFGYLHRWSVGPMRRSIYRGLKNGFEDYRSPTPLVNPVHARQYSNYTNKEKVGVDNGGIHLKSIGTGFNNRNNYTADEADILAMEGGLQNDDDQKYLCANDEEQGRRLESMEDRVQLLERLFQSYYVDDEVFQKLDEAVKCPEKSNRRRHVGSPLQQHNNMVGILGERRSRSGYKKTKSLDSSKFSMDEDSIPQPPSLFRDRNT